MIFLNDFTIPTESEEILFFKEKRMVRMTCFNNYYPFGIFAERVQESFTFEPLTILYGSNGSGKTTLLNIMANALEADRDAPYNRSAFFETYVSMCENNSIIPRRCRFIASDDVFSHLLKLRSYNQDIDEERIRLLNERKEINKNHFTMRSLDDYEELKKVNEAHSSTHSSYVNARLGKNIPTRSNGESAFEFFVSELTENGLYFLDEPENSLSAQLQTELCSLIEDCTRFFNCQIIMSTHSPFMLAAKGAKIYDLDKNPITVSKWTELENVREYYDFFSAHKDEF